MCFYPGQPVYKHVLSKTQMNKDLQNEPKILPQSIPERPKELEKALALAQKQLDGFIATPRLRKGIVKQQVNGAMSTPRQAERLQSIRKACQILYQVDTESARALWTHFWFRGDVATLPFLREEEMQDWLAQTFNLQKNLISIFDGLLKENPQLYDHVTSLPYICCSLLTLSYVGYRM